MALPAILSGRNNSFGAETGSGKTLAYLLPIFEQILQWKENVIKPSFNAPYVLILVPSRELADQIRVMHVSSIIRNIIPYFQASFFPFAYLIKSFFLSRISADGSHI